MDQTQKINGVSKSDAYNQYLAYHQGHTGYKRGRYRGKKWLLNVASRNRARSEMYRSQLATCPRRWNEGGDRLAGFVFFSDAIDIKEAAGDFNLST